jgi:hypothetical protein
MPVRKVSNCGGNIIGAFPSLKNGHTVHYESTIERDFLFFLEFDRMVLRYELQPFVITGTDAEGKPRSYIPDVLITRNTGKTLVECKPTVRLDDPHTKQQRALGETWCNSNDCDYIVITDTDLRTGPQLANLKLLWRYARVSVPIAFLEQIHRTLAPYPEGIPLITLTQYLHNVSPTSTLQPIVFHLLFCHILTADLNQPLLPQTLIRLALPA